jgi:hypothetical protein
MLNLLSCVLRAARSLRIELRFHLRANVRYLLVGLERPGGGRGSHSRPIGRNLLGDRL